MSASKDTLQLRIGPELASRTLAESVRRMLPNASWNQARELCKRGKVKRNGVVTSDAAQRLADGDRIEIDPHARRLRGEVLLGTGEVHPAPGLPGVGDGDVEVAALLGGARQRHAELPVLVRETALPAAGGDALELAPRELDQERLWIRHAVQVAP